MEIKYRLATDKDYPEIVELCERNNLDVPMPGNINFVAEQKSKIKGNKIVGLISLKIKHQIDGLIADNPLVANTLVKMLEGVIVSKNIMEIEIVCDKEKVAMYERANFKVADDNKVIMYKRY